MGGPSAQLRPYNSVLPYKRVEFSTYDSTILRGNLYHATNVSEQAPIVIFTHGIGLVKEQYLENWFCHFLQAGYHVLTYDNRCFGDSDGLPRDHFNWKLQAEDFIDGDICARSSRSQPGQGFWMGSGSLGRVDCHLTRFLFNCSAAALDERIAGIIMFLPCIDGAWDKSRWGEEIWNAAKRHRYQGKLSDGESVPFWPLTNDQAAGVGDDRSVLSGDYVRDWSVVAQTMGKQGGNKAFTGRLTLASFWEDFTTRPTDWFAAIRAPVLWVMATNDVVCGPLEFTREWYDKLQCPKEICILDGEHLAQYFDPGFPMSVEAMLSFLRNHAA